MNQFWTTKAEPMAPEQLALARRVSFWMHAAGVLGGVLGIAGQQVGLATSGAATVIAAYAFFALLLWIFPTERTLLIAVHASSINLSVLVAVSDPIGVTTFFYLWPIVHLAYFFSRRQLIAGSVLMVAGLAAALLVNDSVENPFGVFEGTIISVLLIGVLVHRMHGAERELRRELSLAAETDPLTGLLNRRAFDPALAGLLRRMDPLRDPLSVVMVDADHFKAFNDRHGHLEGDEALRRLARVLREETRTGDVVARLGGEEFVVALPGAGLDAARRFAERVRCRLLQEPVADELRLSVSLGIGLASSREEAPAALLAEADAALYAAKRAGRDRSAWRGADQALVSAAGGPAGCR